MRTVFEKLCYYINIINKHYYLWRATTPPTLLDFIGSRETRRGSEEFSSLI